MSRPEKWPAPEDAGGQGVAKGDPETPLPAEPQGPGAQATSYMAVIPGAAGFFARHPFPGVKAQMV